MAAFNQQVTMALIRKKNRAIAPERKKFIFLHRL